MADSKNLRKQPHICDVVTVEGEPLIRGQNPVERKCSFCYSRLGDRGNPNSYCNNPGAKNRFRENQIPSHT